MRDFFYMLPGVSDKQDEWNDTTLSSKNWSDRWFK